MNFDNEKKQALAKMDSSKKGQIDEQVQPLIEAVNRHPDFYSTSSCSGRIMLFKPAQKKFAAEWLFSSHEPITLEEMKPYFELLPEETIFFRMEPPIIHLCARNLKAADNIIKKANNAGFRRSSVLGLKNRIVVEINIPEKLDAPISKKGRLIVTDNYLKELIEIANYRLIKSRNKIKKLERLFNEEAQLTR